MQTCQDQQPSHQTRQQPAAAPIVKKSRLDWLHDDLIPDGWRGINIGPTNFWPDEWHPF
jgi:hypothetical protein